MKRWFSILGAVLALTVLIGWRLTQKQAKAEAEKKAGAALRSAPALVETTPVVRKDVLQTFEAVGNVEAPLAVDVSPEVTGKIVYLTAREGYRVQAGEVLVRIDPLETETALRREQANLAQARARLSEAQLTRDSRSVNVESVIRQQQAALKTAQAQETQARADHDAQIAAADASITAAEGRLNAAEAAIKGADASITSAQANVENAKTILMRQEALLEKGFVSKQLVDNARTSLKVQDAALLRAREERRSAVAERDAAQAQKQVLERQAVIARNKAAADVAAAVAAVAQAQATLEGAQANTAQTTAYAQNLAALQAQVRVAEANVRTAKAKIADTILRAPLTGIVTRRLVDPGALVSINQPILSLQAVEQVWATVSIPEEISRKIYQSQTARVTFDAMPGVTFAGIVAQILPAADAQSRQFTARVRLDNRSNRIKPGMFGRVTFILAEAKDALVVPMEAVQSDPARPGVGNVMVVADGKAAKRQVQTGMNDGKALVLKSGVTEGEEIIILSANPIKEGQTVRGSGEKRNAETTPSNKRAAAQAQKESVR